MYALVSSLHASRPLPVGVNALLSLRRFHRCRLSAYLRSTAMRRSSQTRCTPSPADRLGVAADKETLKRTPFRSFSHRSVKPKPPPPPCLPPPFMSKTVSVDSRLNVLTEDSGEIRSPESPPSGRDSLNGAVTGATVMHSPNPLSSGYFSIDGAVTGATVLYTLEVDPLSTPHNATDDTGSNHCTVEAVDATSTTAPHTAPDHTSSRQHNLEVVDDTAPTTAPHTAPDHTSCEVEKILLKFAQSTVNEQKPAVAAAEEVPAAEAAAAAEEAPTATDDRGQVKVPEHQQEPSAPTVDSIRSYQPSSPAGFSRGSLVQTFPDLARYSTDRTAPAAMFTLEAAATAGAAAAKLRQSTAFPEGALEQLPGLLAFHQAVIAQGLKELCAENEDLMWGQQVEYMEHLKALDQLNGAFEKQPEPVAEPVAEDPEDPLVLNELPSHSVADLAADQAQEQLEQYRQQYQLENERIVQSMTEVFEEQLSAQLEQAEWDKMDLKDDLERQLVDAKAENERLRNSNAN